MAYEIRVNGNSVDGGEFNGIAGSTHTIELYNDDVVYNYDLTWMIVDTVDGTVVEYYTKKFLWHASGSKVVFAKIHNSVVASITITLTPTDGSGLHIRVNDLFLGENPVLCLDTAYRLCVYYDNDKLSSGVSYDGYTYSVDKWRVNYNARPIAFDNDIVVPSIPAWNYQGKRSLLAYLDVDPLKNGSYEEMLVMDFELVEPTASFSWVGVSYASVG